jgi:predicted  nucleic acid-binding Zn-ribbon protein
MAQPNPQDPAQRILALKAQHASTVRLRAEAEASLEMAKNQREQVYNRLKELGIDPDNADQELSALETQLEETMGKLSEAMNAEIRSYNAITESAKAATFGGKQ